MKNVRDTIRIHDILAGGQNQIPLHICMITLRTTRFNNRPNIFTFSAYHPIYLHRKMSQVKSQSPFPRPMAHRAAPVSVSIALGRASANAVKATAGSWSTGSSESLTFPLHSHMSSARREGSEYHFKIFGMTQSRLKPATYRL